MPGSVSLTATPIGNIVTAGRAARCRVLNGLANRCPNEPLSDYGFCLKHLAGAHAEFEALLTEAKLRHPSARVAGRRR